jgi:hypothetical protein
MTKQSLRPLSVNHSHAAKVYDLPAHHADPFDRMLIAQTLIEDLVILTSVSGLQEILSQVAVVRNLAILVLPLFPLSKKAAPQSGFQVASKNS